MKKGIYFWPSARSGAATEASQGANHEDGHRDGSTGAGRERARRGLVWRRLWGEEEGQTLVEYGLLIGLLALVVIAAVTFFGRRMSNNLYGTSANVLPFNN